MEIRPIKTDGDHVAALERIEELWAAPRGSDAADELDVLTTLVQAYEERRGPILPPDPIEAILFRLEQNGQGRAELQEILGVGRGRVSEILNRKRGLSLAMIRKLESALSIPAAVLVRPTKESA